MEPCSDQAPTLPQACPVPHVCPNLVPTLLVRTMPQPCPNLAPTIRGKFLSRWVPNRKILWFPWQTAIFCDSRDQSRFLKDHDIFHFQQWRLLGYYCLEADSTNCYKTYWPNVKKHDQAYKIWPMVTKLDQTSQNLVSLNKNGNLHHNYFFRCIACVLELDFWTWQNYYVTD